MNNTHQPLVIISIIIAFASCNLNHNSINEIAQLGKEIDSMRIEYDFPAVAYGVIKNDSILVMNALGLRDIESEDSVKISDFFHIGSCTKSFTAFLAGKYVEDGFLEWDTQFFDLFPELAESSHSYYKNMTLKHLLSHRTGLISFKEDAEVSSIIAKYQMGIPENTSLEQRRYHCIAHILTLEPQDPNLPRSKLYSNAGYMAAGLMLEKVSNKTWESLIIEMSDELGLGIHIGWPVEYNPDQPRGHVNPLRWLLESDEDQVPIPEESMNYDWVKGEGENTQYGHRGSNGAFYAFIGINPNTNGGMVVMINTYKEPGLTDIIQLLANTFAI